MTANDQIKYFCCKNNVNFMVAGCNICILCILYYCVLCVLYYICNEVQQNLRTRLGSRKTNLSPPSILQLTVPRSYFCCGSLLLKLWLVLAVRI